MVECKKGTHHHIYKLKAVLLKSFFSLNPLAESFLHLFLLHAFTVTRFYAFVYALCIYLKMPSQKE